MRVLWLEITTDEYELPLAVADTATELAVMSGHCRTKVQRNMWRWKNGKMPRCRYRKVEIDEEETE